MIANKIDMFLILSLLFIIFSYYVFRIIVKGSYLKHLKLTPISYLLEILIFALHANLAYLTFQTKWPKLPPIPDNLIQRAFAIIFITAGSIILTFAWIKLGTKTSLGLDKKKLVVSGIYNYSRNPQLTGYGLILLGFLILYFNTFLLLWFLEYLIIAFFMIKTEEEFLSFKYCEQYREYCKKVPRVFKMK